MDGGASDSVFEARLMHAGLVYTTDRRNSTVNAAPADEACERGYAMSSECSARDLVRRCSRVSISTWT